MTAVQQKRIDYLEAVVLKMGDELKNIRETYDGITRKDDGRIREILGHHTMLINHIARRSRNRKTGNDANPDRRTDPVDGLGSNDPANAKRTLGLPDKRGRAAARSPAPRSECERVEPASNHGTPGDPTSVHPGDGGTTTSEGV